MFDIKIGTLIPGGSAETMIPQLNAVGFESYELDFGRDPLVFKDFDAYVKKIKACKGNAVISSFGLYGNTLKEDVLYRNICFAIEHAPMLDCSVVALFAGGDPDKSIPETMPLFREKFEPLCALAEKNGVRLALEGCGGGWNRGSTNMAYCEDAWKLMFEAVPSPALGLEWEPCHALEHLADPVPQLRRWANKVFHIHGKDGTVAWDVLRQYGLDSGHAFMWNRTPGFGDTNWADVFTILIQAGFVGSCDIEGYHDPVHYDDMEWTAQRTALDYLKRCRGGVEYFPGPIEYRGYQGKRK